MSSASKRKGYSFEVECIAIAEKLGLSTKRAWGSNGRAMGEHEEVDIVIGGEKYQCKRRGKIAKDLFPNEDIVEGQIIRADRQKHPYIVLPLPLFLEKYKKAYDEQTTCREATCSCRASGSSEIRVEDSGAPVRRANEARGR